MKGRKGWRQERCFPLAWRLSRLRFGRLWVILYTQSSWEADPGAGGALGGYCFSITIADGCLQDLVGVGPSWQGNVFHLRNCWANFKGSESETQPSTGQQVSCRLPPRGHRDFMPSEPFPPHAHPPAAVTSRQQHRDRGPRPAASRHGDARRVLVPRAREPNTPAAVKGEGAVSHSASGMSLCYIVTGKYFMHQK